MNPEDLAYVGVVWSEFFPKEVYLPQDPRLNGIGLFRDFFLTDSAGQKYIERTSLATQKYVYFNVTLLNQHLPFNDFDSSLQLRPVEVMGLVGIALSLVAKYFFPHCTEAFVIRPRFYNFGSEVSFGEIKSSTVGQMVSVRGHVVRVSACHPLVESANFLCAKCMKYTFTRFEDGIFVPPNVCSTPKCNNKYLELDRSSVATGDYQRVKLTELDEIAQPETIVDGSDPNAAMASAARVPRTLEVEVRDTLVNTCVPGDLLSIVGVVKTVQMEAPRSGGGGGGKGGGYKESGLHVLYLLANSLLCLKSSGDRSSSSSSKTKTAISVNTTPGATQAHDGAGTQVAPLTLLDERHPQQVNVDSQLDPSGGLSSAGFSQSALGGGSNRDSPFTPDELAAIRSLALSENAFPLLVHSLCPTIFGHELVKAGLLLGLFGGSSYRTRAQGDLMAGVRAQADSNKSSAREGADSGAGVNSKEFQVRADIHVLVVGDPGLGKSQMLRAAATIAPRAVFVCGNTSTAAGLTVSISRDSSGGGKGGGELCIEAGALILADQGVCCIDELDKVGAEQHALLEAMEQQSISIAKSGVVTSLKSRTSVLAAANPAGGHYNRRKTVCENLKMNAALLSRFDLIFILLDRPDESHDRLISEHIMHAHGRNPHQAQSQYQGQSSSEHPNKRARSAFGDGSPSGADGPENIADATLAQRLRHQIATCVQQLWGGVNGGQRHGGVISVELMRRYIEYGKRYVQPALSPGAAKVLQRLYLTMRAQASTGQSIPVTTRHLESLIRLAQARARVDLREEVTPEDAQDVVQLLQESLLDVFTTETGAIDTSRKGGISLAKQVKVLVKVMTRESSLRGSSMFTRADIQALCEKLALDKELDGLIDVMRTECYLLLKGPRLYQLQTT